MNMTRRTTTEPTLFKGVCTNIAISEEIGHSRVESNGFSKSATASLPQSASDDDKQNNQYNDTDESEDATFQSWVLQERLRGRSSC